jgi:hypothetical protein
VNKGFFFHFYTQVIAHTISLGACNLRQIREKVVAVTANG